MALARFVSAVSVLLMTAACGGTGGSGTASGAADDTLSRTSGFPQGQHPPYEGNEHAESANDSAGCTEASSVRFSRFVGDYLLPACYAVSCKMEGDSLGQLGVSELEKLTAECTRLWKSRLQDQLVPMDGAPACQSLEDLVAFLREAPACDVDIALPAGSCVSALTRCARDMRASMCEGPGEFGTIALPASCGPLVSMSQNDSKPKPKSDAGYE